MSAGEANIIDEILAEAEAGPRTVTVRVLLRLDLADRHAALSEAFEQAVSADRVADHGTLDGPVLSAPAIAQQIVDLEAEMEAAKREFVFKRIGMRAWTDLRAKHPPTKEQRESARAQGMYALDHNPDTFPAPAIAASCISPELTLEQARKLEALLDVAQFQQIYQGALDANIGSSSSPKFPGIGGIAAASAALGLPPTTSELPAPSSLEEPLG